MAREVDTSDPGKQIESRITDALPAVGDGSKLEATDRFYREELQLALRNRGMPLEGLRYDVTPTGMHYLLIHFDIPWVDVEQWRLEVGGLVRRPLRLGLDEIKQRPAVTLPVTMECAGNGRALLSPRSISQPWLYEAIGTAEWTGTPLCDLLSEAGLGGATWGDATLGKPVSRFAWRPWSFEWQATPGRKTLCVRATDDEGNVQPVAQPWNFQGMANNMVQRVDVLVEE